MNRTVFMQQLERLLHDVPESDRIDALTYYNDYFDEAGSEREAEVIRELGSPGKVAAIIKADLGAEETIHVEGEVEGYKAPKKKKSIPWPLIIVLVVFASPFLIGVGGGVIGTLIGVLAAIVGVLVAILACGVALVISGLACLVVGIIRIMISPIEGLFLLGSGGIIFAIGLLFTVLFGWFAFKWLPALFRGGINLTQKLFRK